MNTLLRLTNQYTNIFYCPCYCKINAISYKLHVLTTLCWYVYCLKFQVTMRPMHIFKTNITTMNCKHLTIHFISTCHFRTYIHVYKNIETNLVYISHYILLSWCMYVQNSKLFHSRWSQIVEKKTLLLDISVQEKYTECTIQASKN